MKPSILADPILVERAKQLEQLRYYLDSARKGKGTAVFVCGEAGSGKTRLITEFLNEARKQSVTVLSGWCLSNAAVPYFPFFEAFNQYFSNEKEPKEIELKNWLLGPPKENFASPRIVTPQVWKDQAFTAVANALASISEKQPVILFIDDLHWADSASLALVHYLGQIVSGEKILLLASLRSEQLTADHEGRPTPLLETLRLMKRQDLAREISVSSLDQMGVREMANSMLGGSIKDALVKKLSEESQGNPLFVVESLRMLYEHNELVLESGQWGIASETIGIPPKIIDIILQRLGSLVRSQRDILDMASILGEKFDPLLLALVLQQDSIEVIKVLDSIGKETSLVHCEGELYRFDHARTREATYGDISSTLRRVYHSKVAAQLESESQEDKLPFNDLAYQYAQAGDKEKAVKYALAAGQDALARWSNAEAIKHFSYVVQATSENPEQYKQKIVAIEALGDAYFANDNFQQAISTYEQLADTQTGTGRLRPLRKAAQAAFYHGDIPKQKVLLQKTESIDTTDRLEAARIMYQKGGVAGAESDWINAFNLDYAALAIFEEEYAISDAANILLWLGYGSAMLGKLEEGITAALRSIALYDDLGDLRSQIEAYAYAGGTFQACMFIDISNAMLAKAEEIHQKYKIADYIKLIPANVWWSYGLIQQDPKGSVSKALTALEYSEKTDARLYTGAIYGTLLIQHAFAGEISRVDEYYEKLMSLPKYIIENAPSQIYFPIVMCVYYAAKNDYEKSDQYFNQALLFSEKYFPNPFMLASARQLYAWTLSKQGKIQEAQSQIKEAQKVIVDALQRFSHVNIVPSIITMTRPVVNQPFPIHLDLVNVSDVPGKIKKIGDFPEELEIMDVSLNCTMHDGQIELKDSEIGCFEVKSINLTVKALPEKTRFALNPHVTFLNELGETKITSPKPITIIVETSSEKLSNEKPVGASRVPIGVPEVDNVLLGGIPEGYAIILAAPVSNERELILQRFLKGGAEKGEETFCVSTKQGDYKILTEKHQGNFHLFLCNMRADLPSDQMPNIHNVRGIDNLTEIGIALTQAFQCLNQSQNAARRACIEIVSDVLLHHHAMITRKWLSSLIIDLKTHGFTVLAVVNPEMHSTEEVQAILGLFDGEIKVTEKETEAGVEKMLTVRRLYNQPYREKPIVLGKEKIT